MQNRFIVLNTLTNTASRNGGERRPDPADEAQSRPLPDTSAKTGAAETLRNPIGSGWRFALPFLSGPRVTLREVWTGDAGELVSALRREDLAPLVSPFPPSLEGVERFVGWAQSERAAGRMACFAVVPAGCQVAGLLIVHQVEGAFESAAWTFAIAAPFRGTGVFQEAAALAADFAFDTLDARRLEARAEAGSGRANGALRKLGAVQEGVLRNAVRRGPDFANQNLWALVRDDWRCYRANDNRTTHVH